MPYRPQDPAVINIASGVNIEGVPFVTVTWGDKVGQLTTEEARAHAFRILEVVEGAEGIEHEPGNARC